MAGALTDLVERTGLLRVAVRHRAGAGARAAALGLRHDGRAFRPRRVAARHRLRLDLGRRADRGDEARRDGLAALLRSDLRRHGDAPGAELSRDGRASSPCARTAASSARWSRRSAASRRGKARPPKPRLLTRGVEPALSVARRSQRRRLDRGPALSQAAGAADLARRRGDDARRRAVAVRPAAARRRAEAGQPPSPRCSRRSEP